MMCGMHASFPINFTCSFDVLIKCAAQAINSDCPFEEESCKAIILLWLHLLTSYNVTHSINNFYTTKI